VCGARVLLNSEHGRTIIFNLAGGDGSDLSTSRRRRREKEVCELKKEREGASEGHEYRVRESENRRSDSGGWPREATIYIKKLFPSFYLPLCVFIFRRL